MFISAPAIRRRTIWFALIGALILAIAMLAGSSPAHADTAPVVPGQPASVSTDALPTVQIDGVVWAEVIVGNTVYAGGQFTTARPAGSASGVNTVPRSNLLAFDLTTGVLNTTFAPNVNGVVRALAVSPDGTQLYVGGAFTQINGVARSRIASFDVASGTLTSTFAPVANSVVHSIVATATTVYFGGAFTAVANQTRQRLAAVSASNGALLPWAPVVNADIGAMVLSPDGTKLAVGGSFTTLNGSSNPGYGLGMVSSTGTATTNLPFAINSLVRDGGVNAAIESLTSDGSSIYGSGYVFGSGGNLEGAFKASWTDGSIQWIEDCHGDTYDTFPMGGLLYAVGHPHTCANIGGFPERTPRVSQRAIAFTQYVDGTVATNPVSGYYNFGGNPKPDEVDWYPDMTAGTFTGADQAAWDITGNSQYIVLGGEFTAVNGTNQQGLTRFAVSSVAPNKDGPRLSGTNFPIAGTSTSAGTAKLTWSANWDRDNELLTYQIIRNGNTATPVGSVSADSLFYQLPSLSFTDGGLVPGQTYTYQVKAVDPFGNSALSPVISVTSKSGTPTNKPPTAAFTTSVTGNTVAVNGSGSTDSDGTVVSYAWNFGDGTTATGVTASHTYAVSNNYTITLSVTDNGGLSGTTTHAITIGTPPPPPNTASDAFSRTVASGWGSADVGGAWTLSAAASEYSVGGGVGTMTLPTANTLVTAKLNSVSSTSSNSVATVSLPQLPVGANAYISLSGRVVPTGDYRSRLVISPAGAVTIQIQTDAAALGSAATGITFTPGMQLDLRTRVSGTSPTTVQARVWVAGTTEPTTWNVSATDSTAKLQVAGGVGVGLFFATGETGLPRSGTFDNLVVTAG